MKRRLLLALAVCVPVLANAATVPKPKAEPSYFPPAGEWAHKSPGQLGIDAGKLREAVAYAQAHETERARDFSDQRQTFGEPLGRQVARRNARLDPVGGQRGEAVAQQRGRGLRRIAVPALRRHDDPADGEAPMRSLTGMVVHHADRAAALFRNDRKRRVNLGIGAA